MSYYKFEVPVIVKGGFPAIAQGYISPSDYSVGIYQDSLEDLEIVTNKGKPAAWLRLTKTQMADVEEQVWERFAKDKREEEGY